MEMNRVALAQVIAGYALAPPRFAETGLAPDQRIVMTALLIAEYASK
jgi:hypothetical protein